MFQGSFAFSEPETRAVRDFLASLNGQVKGEQRWQIAAHSSANKRSLRALLTSAFLTFHSYSQILMYPFGHALRTYPADVDDLSSTAVRAAQSLQALYGTKYTVGTGADTLCESAATTRACKTLAAILLGAKFLLYSAIFFPANLFLVKMLSSSFRSRVWRQRGFCKRQNGLFARIFCADNFWHVL